MKESKARKTEPPLYLDMEFAEALQRFAQTKPEEVIPPPGRKQKKAKRPSSKDSPVPHSFDVAKDHKDNRNY
jgi:hypothetical protein